MDITEHLIQEMVLPKLAAEVLTTLRTSGNGSTRIDEPSVLQALRDFEPLWEALTLAERGRIVRLLVEGVVYHPAEKDVEIRFRRSGFEALLSEPEIEQAPA